MALRSRDIEVDIDQLDDVAVARRAAQGDSAAFEILYRRHEAAAWRVAQAVAGSRDDAADAVSEAFTNLLQALATGKLNPDVPFYPYLLVATRNAAIDQHRKHARLQPVGPMAAEERPTLSSGPGERIEEAADAGLVAEAFRSLPERWRSVLWLTEVEGIPARDVGARMGLTANGAAQLAHRARSGLRERFLQAHLRHAPRPECVETVGLLGAYAAESLPARSTRKVDAHLESCADCRDRLAELTDVGGTLRAIALPLPLMLAPAALAHYKLSFGLAAATHAAEAGGLAIGKAAGERVMRALAVTTSALLALGVITAGLMTNSGGPTAVPGSRSGGAVAVAPRTDVAQVPSATVTLIANAHPEGAGGAGAFVDESPRVPKGEQVLLAAPAPAAKPQPKPAPRPAPSPTSQPVVGIQVGANVSIATASASVGVGGGCTGLAVNNTGSSCTPQAPTTPGVAAAVATPVGNVSARPLLRRPVVLGKSA